MISQFKHLKLINTYVKPFTTLLMHFLTKNTFVVINDYLWGENLVPVTLNNNDY